MSEGWTYRRLCDAYREERSSNALTRLDENFAGTLDALIKELMAKAADDPQAHRELENARKQAMAMMRLRRQKIIMRAITAQEGPEPDGLGANEHELYERMRALCVEEDGKLGATLYGKREGKAGAGGHGPGPNGLATKRIKVLKEIPAYRGADMATYGPFAQGQEVNLPEAETGWMLKGGFAQGLDGESTKISETKVFAGPVKIKLLADIPAYKGYDQKDYGPFSNGQEVQVPHDEAHWLLEGKLAEKLG